MKPLGKQNFPQWSGNISPKIIHASSLRLHLHTFHFHLPQWNTFFLWLENADSDWFPELSLKTLYLPQKPSQFHFRLEQLENCSSGQHMCKQHCRCKKDGAGATLSGLWPLWWHLWVIVKNLSLARYYYCET